MLEFQLKFTHRRTSLYITDHHLPLQVMQSGI